MSAKTASGATVILPTFNRAGYVAASIESILGQTVPPDQVIVVNDGSTDGTEAALAPFRERIVYLEQDNAGKPAAINAALPLVEGDYIWVFDDDDVACPDALERHLEVLERRPDIGFTFSSAYYGSDDPYTGRLRVERELRPRDFPEEDFMAELLLESYTASPAVVVRTAVQRAAGPYNPELIRSQDWEMALRWGLQAPAARLPDARPTYYRRFHEGARGRRGSEFGAGERVARGRATSRDILRRLAGYIELRHYLPYPLWADEMDAARRRLALSRRLAVRLRKGLWPEALSDLDALAEIGFERDEPTRREAAFLVRGLGHGDAIAEMRAAGLAGDLRRRLAQPGLRPVQRLLARGLYYKLRADLAQRSWTEVRASLAALRGLLDLRGLARQP